MKLKNLLANKNVVTIFGALLIVIVLYAFYNWRLSQAFELISVPVANRTIGPRTEITIDMISTVEIRASELTETVLTNISNDNQPKKIVGRYTNVNCTIPTGSFFFDGMIVLPNELPDSFLDDADLKEGMVAYNYSVDMMQTYGNSIYPGNYVDIYFKGVQDNKIIFGKLIQNVKVLAVKDSSGNHVFENMEEKRTPSQIILAVTSEIHELLRTVEYIGSAEIILVPTNVAYRTDESNQIAIEITSDEIKAYIELQRA